MARETAQCLFLDVVRTACGIGPAMRGEPDAFRPEVRFSREVSCRRRLVRTIIFCVGCRRESPVPLFPPPSRHKRLIAPPVPNLSSEPAGRERPDGQTTQARRGRGGSWAGVFFPAPACRRTITYPGEPGWPTDPALAAGLTTRGPPAELDRPGMAPARILLPWRTRSGFPKRGRALERSFRAGRAASLALP